MDSSEIQELLRRLTAIPSVNRMGREDIPPASHRMLDCIEPWLHARGIQTQRQPAGAGEGNLIARVGPPGAPTILFDAHTDTVPADGWEDRAFLPRVQDGRLYARGACDTKGSMTAMLVALAHAASSADELRNQIVFGTVNADREAFANAIRDLGVFEARWPGVVKRLITGRFPMEAHEELLRGEARGIKNVIAL